MKHSLTVRCLCLIFLITACAIVPVYSADVTIGLLTGSNKLGEVEEAAYAWAKDNFKTTTLLVDKSGKFKNDGGTALQPEQFAVLWMFYTETNTLPEPFLADATIKSILDYVEAGGGVFLSALALRYVVELGVEKGGDPRVFGPLGKDPPEIGVVPTADGKTIPSLRDLIPVNRFTSPVWRKLASPQISTTLEEQIQKERFLERKHAAVVLAAENVLLSNMRSATE